MDRLILAETHGTIIATTANSTYEIDPDSHDTTGGTCLAGIGRLRQDTIRIGRPLDIDDPASDTAIRTTPVETLEVIPEHDPNDPGVALPPSLAAVAARVDIDVGDYTRGILTAATHHHDISREQFLAALAEIHGDNVGVSRRSA